jgi:hypothetical protein
MAKRMDPKLVASQQPYEVDYFARKHDLTKEQALNILAKAGPSREKANEEAEKLKELKS